jgi:hypothetical protein
LALASAHAFCDLDLGEAGGAATVGELAGELAAFERGGDAEAETGVVLCEFVDEGVEIVTASHETIITHIWVIGVWLGLASR